MASSSSSSFSPSLSLDTLQNLLSMDASERKSAEAQLQGTNIIDRLTIFVQALNNGGGNLGTGSGALLHMVAVLLRRDILKLNPAADAREMELLQNLVHPLLQAFANAPQTTKAAIGNCLAEICSVLETTTTTTTANHGQINNTVITQILSLIGTSASEGNLASLQLLVALSERAPTSFATVALPSLPQLISSLVQHPVFHTELEEEMNPNWPDKGRLYSVATELVTTTAIALSRKTGQVSNSSTSLDPSSQPPNHEIGELGTQAFLPLLSISNIISNHNTTAKILPHWMQASQTAPDLFIGTNQTVWERTVLLCLQISGQDHDTKVAIQAMHVLNHLVAHLKNRLPDHMRQTLMRSVIPRLMNILHSEVDSDVDRWATEPVTSSVVDKDTFSDDDGEAAYAYEQMEAWIGTSPALAMSITLPSLERNLEGDWANQWACAVCIQACAEEAPKTFTSYIPTALQASLQLAATSNNARVQYQSIQLIGTLCETGAGVVWDSFSERIIQVLVAAMGSHSDRVKAMACTALVSYCRPNDKEKCEGDRYVTPYLSDLIAALVRGPLSGPTVVQSRAIQAVICLAHASAPAFVPFYSSVMPGLLNLARQSKSHEYEDVKLQGTAIEAATILGQSIGDDNKHLFAQDASLIMQLIIPVLQQEQNDSNSFIPMGQLLSACARIASVAGEAYAEYAHSVMPHLFSRIQAPTDIEIAEGNVADNEAMKNNDIKVDEETGEESVTVVVPGRGLTKLTISTSKIEEKTEAIRGLYEHAVALEALFAPYAQSSLVVLLPLIQFRYAADVRATTAQSLSAVYEAACCQGDDTGDFTLCGNYLPKLLLDLTRQIQNENEMEALYALADATSEILYSTYSRRHQHSQQLLSKLPLHDAKVLVKSLISAMVPCLERRSKISNVLANSGNLSGEDEKASYEEVLQDEEKLLAPLVDSVGYTLKIFGESFYPIFKECVAPVLGPYLGEGNDIRGRLAAVCLFDDCVEFCGQNAQAEVGPVLINGILHGLDNTSNGGDVELMQASVYGIIQLARSCCAHVLVPHAQIIMNNILSVANGPKDEAKSLMLFENCISAVASLFLIGQAPFRSSGLLKRNVAVSLFLDNIPLTEDYDEAKMCHAGFCDMIQKGEVDMKTESCTITQKIGEILAVVQTGEEVASDETCSQLANILAELQQNPSFDSDFSRLPESSRSAIHGILHGASSRVVTP